MEPQRDRAGRRSRQRRRLHLLRVPADHRRGTRLRLSLQRHPDQVQASSSEKKPSPADTVQARTFRALSASNASVIDGGETHSLSGLPLTRAEHLLDRIPAARRGPARRPLRRQCFVKETPRYFTTASTTDAASFGSVTADPIIGSSFSTNNTTKARSTRSGARARRRRRRLRRRLPGPLPRLVDRDHGLLGDALRQRPAGRATTPSGCSGGLPASRRRGGVSTAAPFDGVVVRWRVLDAGRYLPPPRSGPQAEPVPHQVLHGSAFQCGRERRPLPHSLSSRRSPPSRLGCRFRPGPTSAWRRTIRWGSRKAPALDLRPDEDGADGIHRHRETHNGTDPLRRRHRAGCRSRRLRRRHPGQMPERRLHTGACPDSLRAVGQGPRDQRLQGRAGEVPGQEGRRCGLAAPGLIRARS